MHDIDTVKPEVIVTVREGSKRRRYVVTHDDRDYILKLSEIHPREDLWNVYFGAQWLRGYGRVDEMYRSLCLAEVEKIETASRERVWGA